MKTEKAQAPLSFTNPQYVNEKQGSFNPAFLRFRRARVIKVAQLIYGKDDTVWGLNKYVAHDRLRNIKRNEQSLWEEEQGVKGVKRGTSKSRGRKSEQIYCLPVWIHMIIHASVSTSVQ